MTSRCDTDPSRLCQHDTACAWYAEHCRRDHPEFRYTPLGPVTGPGGARWCCGLHCGTPCPYGLKLPQERS